MGSSGLVGRPQHWRCTEASLHLLHTLQYSTYSLGWSVYLNLNKQ